MLKYLGGVTWTIDYADEAGFQKFLKKLDRFEKTCVEIGIYKILALYGDDLLSIGKVKHIKGALYEYKLGPTTTHIASQGGIEVPHMKMQLRIFITFRHERVVVVLAGYDKGRSPSKKKQQDEIARAMQILADY